MAKLGARTFRYDSRPPIAAGAAIVGPKEGEGPLGGYFDEVVGSGMDESRCTKEEVIQEVFLRLGLSEEQKKQALMIGDRKHDIVGAKACGIASLGVRIGYAEEGELEAAGADFVKDTVKDMEAFLLEA